MNQGEIVHLEGVQVVVEPIAVRRFRAIRDLLTVLVLALALLVLGYESYNDNQDDGRLNRQIEALIESNDEGSRQRAALQQELADIRLAFAVSTQAEIERARCLRIFDTELDLAQSRLLRAQSALIRVIGRIPPGTPEREDQINEVLEELDAADVSSKTLEEARRAYTIGSDSSPCPVPISEDT